MGSYNSSFPFCLSEKLNQWLFQRPQIMEIILLLFFSVIMIVNLSLNVLVVLAVTRSKQKQPPINYLFLNLALSDMLVATSLIPQYIIRTRVYASRRMGWHFVLQAFCRRFHDVGGRMCFYYYLRCHRS